MPEPSGAGAEFGSGVLTRSRLVGGSPNALVLDTARDDWIRVPSLWSDRSAGHGWSRFNTRRGLLVFGGARWSRRHPEGKLLNDASLWTPGSP